MEQEEALTADMGRWGRFLNIEAVEPAAQGFHIAPDI